MEKMWFYSDDGKDKKGPVQESHLRALNLPPNTLVWSEGMANWSPLKDVAAFQAGSDPAPVPLAATLSPVAPVGGQPLPAGIGWLTFVGVIHIIMGIFACLSCFGLIYGIPMIMGGVALLGAKNLLGALTTVDASTVPFLEKLFQSFKLVGWGYILMLVTTLIVLVIYFVFIVALIAKFAPNFPH